MDWNYSECGGESDNEDDSNPDTSAHPLNISSSSEQTELVTILGETLELPKGLCAQPEIFFEFFAPENLWNELPLDTRNELVAKHLPQFPPDHCDVVRETQRTIHKLFHRERFAFNTSPLVEFQRQLEEGTYLPEIVKYRAKIARMEKRERRYQECEYISRLASKLAASRKSHLALGQDSKMALPKPAKSGQLVDNITSRARKRYLAEISRVVSESNLPLADSDEEEVTSLSSSSSNSLTNFNNSSYNVRVPRRPGRPSLSSLLDQSLDNIGEFKIQGTSTAAQNHGKTLASNTFNDGYLRKTLQKHKKRKSEDPVSYCWNILLFLLLWSLNISFHTLSFAGILRKSSACSRISAGGLDG